MRRLFALVALLLTAAARGAEPDAAELLAQVTALREHVSAQSARLAALRAEAGRRRLAGDATADQLWLDASDASVALGPDDGRAVPTLSRAAAGRLQLDGALGVSGPLNVTGDAVLSAATLDGELTALAGGAVGGLSVAAGSAVPSGVTEVASGAGVVSADSVTASAGAMHVTNGPITVSDALSLPTMLRMRTANVAADSGLVAEAGDAQAIWLTSYYSALGNGATETTTVHTTACAGDGGDVVVGTLMNLCTSGHHQLARAECTAPGVLEVDVYNGGSACTSSYEYTLLVLPSSS